MFVPLRDVTVGGLLTRLAQALPDQPALIYPERRWTFAELERDCVRLAKALAGAGVERGERVAVWATNKPEWILLQFALAKLGAILVTVNTALRAAELGYLLRQSGARTLILIPAFRDLDYLAELERSGARPERVFVIGAASFEELWEHPPGELPDDVGVDDVINMQYTSGTTGFPKGVRLSSRNIVNNGHALGQGLGYSPADRLCLSVPLFHCFGCVIGVLASFTHGVTLCPIEAFEPLAVLETVERERCTAVYGVPTMFLAKLEHPEFTRFDLSSLRTGVMAGSLCPEPLMRRVMREMNLREITIAYGLTESSPAITMTPRHDPVELRTQTVGKVLPELEVRIMRPDGTDCDPHEPGELVTRGYVVMQGYHEDPEATSRTVRDGWLHTGDQATMCPEGYVRITGRIKDLIIRGGENVAPKEVEDALREHPSVADAAVYGVTSEKFGEEVAAAVRLKGGSAREDELVEFLRGRLARFKVPRYFRFVDEFPLTASGKVQKFRLREAHEALLSQPGMVK